MFAEDCKPNRPDVAIVSPDPRQLWTDADLAAIIGHGLVERLLDNNITPAQAYEKARLAGSYARRHLQNINQWEYPGGMIERSNFEAGLRVVTGAFGGGK